jgi:hypothetical protein
MIDRSLWVSNMSEKSGKAEREEGHYTFKRTFKTSRRSQPLDFNALLTATWEVQPTKI